MAGITNENLAIVFGVLGNIFSILVYLAPMPTFYRIFRRKSTEGFHSIPYSMALFSAMLLLYYAFLKVKGAFLLVTINCIGFAIESVYLLIFMIYASKKAKIQSGKLLLGLNVGAYGLIVVLTHLLTEGPQRITVVGWICAFFSVIVFAAPLSIMGIVIRTKSVEFMPFWLSFFLTLCAVMWFFYGLLIKDYYVATPNVLGFAFGIAQMTMYMLYRDPKGMILPESFGRCTIAALPITECKKVNISIGIKEPVKPTETVVPSCGPDHGSPNLNNKV
ncbi:bidirectional sugar transporter NEC1-like [Punica granatum]|uniref:Bidirectional sugar transporter SWEET n=1 Tax=Punica granatum TaxID=22663 RepID=A0A218XQJ2_PUNGR|nr:bidirectional sugar transporter NEC1-like [Punica granatum]OWM87204.1 hypothetical protein CDL15_Pgr010236 [Punica granatum]